MIIRRIQETLGQIAAFNCLLNGMQYVIMFIVRFVFNRNAIHLFLIYPIRNKTRNVHTANIAPVLCNAAQGITQLIIAPIAATFSDYV